MRVTARVQRPQKQIVAQPVPIPATVSGWDAISPLANMPIDRAVQIDNWICRPGWIEPRPGYLPQCTGLGSSNTPVQTVMSYNSNMGTRKLFGVAAGNIYDCSNSGTAIITPVTGLGSSRLQYTIFANPNVAQYLVTVDGVNNPWIFNGTSWSQPNISIGYATGSITWSVNIVPNETINLNGTIVTFVSGIPVGNQVQIQSSLSATLTALYNFLINSTDSNIVQFTYVIESGTTLILTAATTGVDGNSLTFSAGYATGSIFFPTNPSNGDTITLDGVIVEFVTSTPVGFQVQIGSTLASTLANLLSFLNSNNAAAGSSFSNFSFTVNNNNTLFITSTIVGIPGNLLTIAASAATTSGQTLTGGSTAAASGTNLTGGGVSYGITPNQFIHVNSYMNRLWFVPVNSTNVVYLQTVGGISGAASVFPLGQLMKKGGYIMAIGTWTVDTRQNVDEYIAFITSRGEVLVYQGTDPTTANTFALTGMYQIGAPIGRRCFLRISGDLQIITVDGVVGMSEMLSTDRAAANRVSLTSIIMNQMNLAAQQYRNNFGWQLIEYPIATLAILNIPIRENNQQMQFVMNTITGAWSRFIGLDSTGSQNSAYGINANCWEVDAYDNIYFGGNDGTVYQWFIGTGDNTQPITCVVQTAYNNFGNGAQLKRYTMLQPLITTTGTPVPSVGINVDFNQTNILSTPTPFSSNLPLWDHVNWDQFDWPGGPVTLDFWTNVQGIGHYVSIVTQLTTTPLPTDPTATTQIQLNGWNILAESGAFV